MDSGLKDVFLGMLVIVFGLYLVPTVQDAANAALSSTTGTPAGGILKIITLLYVALIAFIAYKLVAKDG